MFFVQEIIYDSYNMIFVKIDIEILHRIFLDATRRFDYDLKVKINDKDQDVLYVDLYKEYLVICIDEEDETIPSDVTIEFYISLTWKIDYFNRLRNTRSDEINMIHEVWSRKDGNEFKFIESNFDYDIFKLRLDTIPTDSIALVDKNMEDTNEIIDVEFNEINDKQITMNE